MTAKPPFLTRASVVLSVLSTLWAPFAGGPAAAQGRAPGDDTRVDALVSALAGGPPTRSFRRTQLPDADSNLCAGQAAGGKSRNARNLEVVPYAGDTTPGLNLDVQFASASDRLTPADKALLDRLAQALQRPELAGERFAVAGHTDTTGDTRINLELSCARALAVRRHLQAKGVAAARLSAYGFGSTRLLAADAPAGAVNRRVEIRKAPEP
jgi:outer membrane protein OmpA-like peptidoglycan-associated protein